MAVRIVTDSTCDLPGEYLRELDIVAVPLYVTFGGTTRKECDEISVDEFYQALRSSPHFPRTSQPTPQDFLAVYEPLIAQGDTVISLHISSKLSGTLNSARLAAQLLDTDRLHILDPHSTSIGLGIQAVDAARLAREGGSADEVIARIRETSESIHLYFVVEDLHHLQKNGRIGKAAALLGSLLNLKPLLTLKGGEILPQEKIPGKTKALERMVEKFSELTEGKAPRLVGVGDADEPGASEFLLKNIGAIHPGVEIIASKVGCVIGAHTGRGTVTLGWF